MTNKARFRVGGNGSATLPITGGTDEFTTKPLEEGYERIYFSLAFYSDSERTTQVTPTSGTVSFFASDDGVEFKIQGGEFEAADVSEITQPAAKGNFEKARVVFDSVDAGLYAYSWVTQTGVNNEG